jgi:hypothetical protein
MHDRVYCIIVMDDTPTGNGARLNGEEISALGPFISKKHRMRRSFGD